MHFLKIFGSVSTHTLGDCHNKGVYQGRSRSHGMIFSHFTAVYIKVYVCAVFFGGMYPSGETKGFISSFLFLFKNDPAFPGNF